MSGPHPQDEEFTNLDPKQHLKKHTHTHTHHIRLYLFVEHPLAGFYAFFTFNSRDMSPPFTGLLAPFWTVIISTLADFDLLSLVVDDNFLETLFHGCTSAEPSTRYTTFVKISMKNATQNTFLHSRSVPCACENVEWKTSD